MEKVKKDPRGRKPTQDPKIKIEVWQFTSKVEAKGGKEKCRELMLKIFDEE
jgi:hypothetical protein